MIKQDVKPGLFKQFSERNKLTYFQQHQFRIEVILVLVFFLINGTVLATSVVMEAQRTGDTLPFSLWEPFVWEYSSAVATMVLLPGLAWLLKNVSFDFSRVWRSLGIYWAASVLFSSLHIGIMVLLRKGIYWMQGGYYDFGHIWFEMFYEYRKDLWSFVFLLGVIQAYRFIVSRLQGEANPIQEGENEPENVQSSITNLSNNARVNSANVNLSNSNDISNNDAQNLSENTIDRFLVKKLGKEFIINIGDVEWLESSGNYVNMHVKERIYPYRSTLTRMIERIETKGFCRIHRSFAVRLDAIESIEPQPSGDSEVTLLSGKKLTLSRRYKEAFRNQL